MHSMFQFIPEIFSGVEVRTLVKVLVNLALAVVPNQPWKTMTSGSLLCAHSGADLGLLSPVKQNFIRFFSELFWPRVLAI